VHGWKHDANSDDPDFLKFKELVKRLANIHEGKKQVLGIYVSRYATFIGWPVDNLSFWSKKRIADRIAESAVVTKIVGAIGSLRDRRRPDLFIAMRW
jgi:hypothetical protein